MKNNSTCNSGQSANHTDLSLHITNLYYDLWPDAPQHDDFSVLLKDFETRISVERYKSRRTQNALTQANQTIDALYDRCKFAEQNLYLIQNSRGHRLLSIYYPIRHKLLPVGSLRYKLVKFLFRGLQKIYRLFRNSAAQGSDDAFAIPTVSREEGYSRLRICNRIDICAVPHTAYVAKMLQSFLHSVGLQSEIHLSQPAKYKNIPYIMICPQNFTEFPELYIAFQMEQTINQRWLTDRYLTILRSAYAVFDYSLVNIEYFSKDPVIASKLFYLPIDICADVFDKKPTAQDEEKEYDILFYGSISSEHRQMYLQTLGRKFKLKIVTEKFGEELYEEMNKAKIIINIHYYEGALLETTRLYEVLSVCDALIVSERSNDPTEDARLENIVDFVEIGDIEEMADRLEYWLTHEDERRAKVQENQKLLETRANAAYFYTMRFLLANDIITFDHFYEETNDYIHFSTNRQCLSLPETNDRRASFDYDNKYGFEVFPGLKHYMGWIGCGMSYKYIFRKAIDLKLDNILICEDDTYFPDDFAERFDSVLNYVQKHDDWNVFSGIMSDIGRVSVLDYAHEDNVDFVYLNRMISMVFNLYDKSMFRLIADWDHTTHDVEKNTIDRYLEKHKLRVLTTSPFLVGHKEDLCSTLWGADNTIYSDLIGSSSNKLKELVDAYKCTLNSEVSKTENAACNS